MQKLDIRNIKKTLGAHMALSDEVALTPDGVKLVGPVRFDLKLTNAGSRILVDGRLRYGAEIACSRCAQMFTCAQDVEVHEEFLPAGSDELPPGPDLNPEELNVFVYDEDRIDIEEVLRQNVIATLPIQPLCRPECAGLCTVCGVNRNDTPCQCETSHVDPRWEGLRKFIKKDG